MMGKPKAVGRGCAGWVFRMYAPVVVAKLLTLSTEGGGGGAVVLGAGVPFVFLPTLGKLGRGMGRGSGSTEP